MSGVVYSTLFAAGTYTAASTTVYTVPAGNVAVLRCITMWGNNTAANPLRATVNTNDTNGIILDLPFDPGERQSNLWNGALVLPAGRTMRVQVASGLTVYVTLSGHLLTLP